MKIEIIQNLNSFSGSILMPTYEISASAEFIKLGNELEIPTVLFSGKKEAVYITKHQENICIAIGLGKHIDYATTKKLFRRIAHQHKEILSDNVALLLPKFITLTDVEAIVGGLVLGTYNLGHFKSDKKEHPLLKSNFKLQLVGSADHLATATRAVKIAQAQLAQFALVDMPPNVVTPKYLSDWARNKGAELGIQVTIIGLQEAIKLGLGAFVAVGKGSDNEPQFIILNYQPKITTNTTKHVGLVGKGITFDTGGLNIKTAGMLHMKCDMAGAGAVLASMQLIADLQLPHKVTAIIPCAENAIDSKSFLPSDVIQSYSGKTIEIIDTDAEGRLILADGLSYLIKNYNPDIIIDIATLTGSSVSTFGYECAALFTNNNELAQKLQDVGSSIGEKLWQLPLWDDYKSDIESDIADVKNYSGKPVAGAISAAKFLEYFTDEHPSWVHLDIAGVAFGDDEFAKSKHATGFGVHLLTSFIEKL